MALVKVAHALAHWTSHFDRGNPMEARAFRGQVVDIPEGEDLDRLRSLGAVVPPDVDLTRPGRMLALPEGASDEEILSWVANATESEIEALAAERPNLADRIEGAATRTAEAYKANMALMETAYTRAAAAAERRSEPQDLTSGDAFPGVTGTPSPTPEGVTDELLSVVRGSVRDVADWIADHPDRAEEVLDAETISTDGHPRQTIINSVQAAIAHRSQ